MTPFQDLHRSPLAQAPVGGPLGNDQNGLDERFPLVVAQSPFRLWSPGDTVPRDGRWLLIGVATWSGSDMRLLDAVSRALREEARGAAVAVFDVAACSS